MSQVAGVYSFTTDDFLYADGGVLLITVMEGRGILQILTVARTSIRRLEHSGVHYFPVEHLSAHVKQSIEDAFQKFLIDAVERVNFSDPLLQELDKKNKLQLMEKSHSIGATKTLQNEGSKTCK